MSSLVIPVVIWGHRAPTHCISSILMTPSQSHIVTGCKDGSLCVWDVTNADNLQVQPRMMLFGHSSAITCLAMGSASSNTLYIVSCTDNGEMCLWDLIDGRCVESARMSVVHTSVQAYQLLQCHDLRLMCSGYYPEIHVIHPSRLEILFSLCAQIHSDWISAFCLQRPIKKESDVVVAVTVSGMVKVWTIPGGVSKPGPRIFEDESKSIHCLNAQALSCCGYNQRTVLIVCSEYWQGDFSLLCSGSSPRSERWMGGEFIGIDRVIVWSNEGRGYLYRLTTRVNADKENNNRHITDPSSPRQMDPQLYSIFDISNNEKSLEFSPAMLCVLRRRSRESKKFLLRGDSHGQLTVWQIPDCNDKKTKLVRQESFENLPVTKPKCSTTLSEEWNRTDPKPKGLIDQLNKTVVGMLEVTATMHLRSRNQLACGRNDGSIVLVSASLAIILQLLDNGQEKDILSHQVLYGHTERVNCLLYPYDENARYDPSHLVSGGVDFTVCLWDIYAATKLHTFCVHGGEITQLLVPPDNCNAEVLSSICAIAGDHSLSLLSLKERKCVLFASRHHFPIQTVKWRPHDDFVVIGCSDGTVYVWQMETGHLDRIVQGPAAADILDACEESQNICERLSDPITNIAQVLKRRGPSAFRNSTQLQNKKAEDAMSPKSSHSCLIQCSQASPMMVQGLKTNVNDSESHIIFFDTEALIGQLLSEEYVALSPNSSEVLKFYTTASEESGFPDTQKRVGDFMSKVRDKADGIGKKLQLKVDFSGLRSSPLLSRREVEAVSSNGTGALQKSTQSPPPLSPNRIPVLDHSTSVTFVAAQILLSFLHAWGLDAEVDRLCLMKLGLLRPKHLTSFGLVSTGGQMSLLLPGWRRRLGTVTKQTTAATTDHWQISSSVTTQHLLAVISVANTLMSLSNATFMKSRHAKPISPRVDDGAAELNSALQSQNKHGWSQVAALHCVLLPQLVGKMQFKAPQLDLLAQRWQDRCVQIREAAQALLLAELRRMGPEGRRRVVKQWGPYLPSYVNPSMTLIADQRRTSTKVLGVDDDEGGEAFGAAKGRSFSTALSRRTRRRSKTVKHEK